MRSRIDAIFMPKKKGKLQRHSLVIFIIREIFALLGRYAVSNDSALPMFQDTIGLIFKKNFFISDSI
jgi:hypothetical protein